MDRYNGVIWFM